jgi:hypothetical protein
MEEIRNEYKVLVGKLGAKRPLGKFRLLLEDMHLIKIG